MTEATYCRGRNLVTRQVGSATLIVPVRGHVGDLESIYSLNEVGSLIWSLLDGRHTLPEIVTRIRAEFQVEESEAREDAGSLIASLAEAQLVVPAGVEATG